MAYKEVTTTGPIEWPHLFEHDRDMEGYEGKYVECEGGYTVNQVLSKDEYEKLKSAGTMKRPNQKRLLDGELVIKYERKHVVRNGQGQVVAPAGGAPKVFDAEGQVWDTDVHGRIGNGSIAEVTNLISTFKGRDGKPSARTSLLRVKIIDYVPVPERDDGIDDEAA